MLWKSTTNLRTSIPFMVWLIVCFVSLLTCDSRPPEASPLSSSSILSTGQQRPLAAVKIDAKGNSFLTQVLKQQLANELRLPLRDLRIIDPSYPSQIQATFLSRPGAILFSIENIKVVLKHNEALIFSPFQAEIQRFVPILLEQMQQLSAPESSLDLERDNGEMRSRTTLNSSLNRHRFELIVLETALNLVCTTLLNKVRALEPAVASALHDLRAESRGLDVIQTQADELLPLKNMLDELKKRVKEIKRAISEVLDSDEDMAMMCLTDTMEELKEEEVPVGLSGGSDSLMGTPLSNRRRLPKRTMSSSIAPAPESNFMSVEILFENYLHESEWIASELDDLIDEITNTEENVVLQLDLLRNRILRFELTLSISSFVATCGALATGLFGMNLLNHFETNKSMFYVITAFIAAIMASLFHSLKKYAKMQKLF